MSSITNQIRKLYSWSVRACCTLQSPFLLFVRLYWGVQLSQNGWGKLHNLARVTEFFGISVSPLRAPPPRSSLQSSSSAAFSSPSASSLASSASSSPST